jgi:hypothetical protein
VRLEGLCKLEKKHNNHIGNKTHDLPASSIVPQPTTLPHDPEETAVLEKTCSIATDEDLYY